MPLSLGGTSLKRIQLKTSLDCFGQDSGADAEAEAATDTVPVPWLYYLI